MTDTTKDNEAPKGPSDSKAMLGVWLVERHGGASTHRWRKVYSGEEVPCRTIYEQERTNLRQGGVRLLDGNGETVLQVFATRLRTRW